MKIVLLQDFKSLGAAGDIVEVNDGYAKNFLIPKKLASEATRSIINEHEQRVEKEKRQKEKERQQALELKQTISTKTVEVAVKCGEGKMYGSVTAQDIAKGLAKQGIEIDKRKITIPEPIKQLGEHIVEVWLYKETTVKMKINVVKEQ
ncbi:MAG: 50S ribosomal protein L9 [Clostridia bacterium]|nr:50S ribosomal protein L9 [Clostridia bacterium]